MKFTIQQPEFLRALERASRAVSGRATLPALGSILIEATETGVTASATDLEMTIVAPAEARVGSFGGVLIPARRIIDAVKGMEGEISFSMDAKHVASLKAGRASAKLCGLASTEAAPLQRMPEQTRAAFDSPNLIFGLRKVAPAMGLDQTRAVLLGVAMQERNGEILLTATDGRRLHRSPIDCSAAPGGLRIIIPSGAVNAVIGLATSSAASVHVSSSLIEIGGEGWALTSKLIDGNSPNFEQVIPAESETTMRCDREALLDAVSACSKMAASDKFSAASIKIACSGPECEVIGASADVGEARRVVPLAVPSELTISLNPAYLVAMLRASASDVVALEYTDSMSPVAIREPQFLAVAMPMRTTN